MRAIVEALLKDVDADIRELMLAETTEGSVMFTSPTETRTPSNWEMLSDPLFFIIQWQELRHENRNNQKDN